MAFDYKKEYKEFYMPKNKPEIVNIPEMNFIAVRGMGDPNEEGGTYKEAIGLLYAIAFTIKMSKKGNHQIEGYFDYVVPPLEGFWWQDGIDGMDYSRKDEFHWISVIRLPDFVTEADFAWAVEGATRKKKTDFSKVEFLTIAEGMCVQCMHIGPFDQEPETVARWISFCRRMDMKMISPRIDYIMKFICRMPGGFHRRSGEQLSGIQFERNNSHLHFEAK